MLCKLSWESSLVHVTLAIHPKSAGISATWAANKVSRSTRQMAQESDAKLPTFFYSFPSSPALLRFIRFARLLDFSFPHPWISLEPKVEILEINQYPGLCMRINFFRVNGNWSATLSVLKIDWKISLTTCIDARILRQLTIATETSFLSLSLSLTQYTPKQQLI